MIPSALVVRIVIFALVVSLWPQLASAHHEAIFGPQSSLFLSAPAYASMQMFSRRLGDRERTQETTGLVSGGISPWSHVPLSFTVIVPASVIVAPGGETTTGVEDAIVGTRYRYDLKALQDRLGGEGNFLMAMAAVEVPTGNVDHRAFRGPLDYMGAALGSVERPPFSGLAYLFYRRNATVDDRRTGDHLLVGGGGAYTPWDDPKTERLVSFQLGLSYETYFRSTVAGVPQDDGGRALLVHPTVVWGPGHRVLIFGLVTLPIAQTYRDEEQEERWRVGAGAMYLFGY